MFGMLGVKDSKVLFPARNVSSTVIEASAGASDLVGTTGGLSRGQGESKHPASMSLDYRTAPQVPAGE